VKLSSKENEVHQVL